jgi:hypothetical protein
MDLSDSLQICCAARDNGMGATGLTKLSIKASALLLAVLIATDAWAAAVAQRGRTLIEAASSKSNIFELSSFRLAARVTIDNFGKLLDGTYSLLWNGPDQWREEISFPGYSQIQVGNKGMVYIKRNLDHIPYRVSQLHSTLGFGWRFNPGPWTGEEIKKIRNEKVGKKNLLAFG